MTLSEEEFQNKKREAFISYLESGDDEGVEFDLYAQNVDSWLWLQELIPGIVVSSAGGVAPFEAQGLLHGHPFYYRDRHGYASLSIGAIDGEAPYLGDTTLYGASTETSEGDGEASFVKNLLKLVPKLERTPFPYEFQGRKIEWGNVPIQERKYRVVEGEFDEFPSVGWGYFPEEAFQELAKPSEYLLSRGWTEEIQREIYELRAFSPVPVKTDERKYPEVDPPFAVNPPEALR